MKITSAPSRADAEAGYTPPSKTGSSAKELPGPSTAKSCSRPDGDSLKIRILPAATTNRPWHGSPSLNSVSPRAKRRLLTREHNVRISPSVSVANSCVFRRTVSLFTGAILQVHSVQSYCRATFISFSQAAILSRMALDLLRTFLRLGPTERSGDSAWRRVPMVRAYGDGW